MAQFTTHVVIPDQQESISGFFRVIAPVLTIVIFAGLTACYYPLNGYAPPVFLGTPLFLLAAILLPILLAYLWYNQNYAVRGDLQLSENAIDMHWANPSRHYHFDLAKISKLKVIYDGYDSLWGGAKGTENALSFTDDKGEVYYINFHLGSEEAASDMAKVLKTWYDNGVQFTETNLKGEPRFLMLYSAKNKQNVLNRLGRA